MGLKITRYRKSVTGPPNSSANASSIWSSRDLCPVEMTETSKPTFVEPVTPDTDGHLGVEQITQLFDRLWKMAGERSRVIAHLDMSQVKTTDNNFASELEFFRRQLQRRAGEVRLINA